MLPSVSLSFSGDRFSVLYRLTGDEATARAKAQTVCIEQTIEFPAELVPEGDIRDYVFGRIESFQAVDGSHYEADISYAVEISSFELTQLINVIFGNVSLIPGVRVQRLQLPERLSGVFSGPRFGRAGLRTLLNAPTRPLLSTALKPMGLSAGDLAHQTYQFALGGLDLIKDDHGLANQELSPFQERAERCATATAKANRETGGHCIYAPNISAPADQVVDRALFARQAGAGALLVAPGLVGWDTMRLLADDDRIGVPILCHPTFGGSYVTCPDNGLSHGVLYGQFVRLAGGDVSVFPNYVGRFSFSREECRGIVDACAEPMGHLLPIFPAPAGGMSILSVPDMVRFYGNDVVLMIGGGLHKFGPDLTANCRRFRELVEQST
jgi:ribulose-bisphosphate carboxylase large chain